MCVVLPFHGFSIFLTNYFQTENDFTAGMLGLDDVLRDVGVDSAGLQQLGIQTGPRLTTQPGTGYMDEDMSDEDLPEPTVQKRSYYKPVQAPMVSTAVVPVSTKKTKIVKIKRPIERKKSVYEMFPDFTPNRPLDFVSLFGQRAKKQSRVWSKDAPPIRKQSLVCMHLGSHRLLEEVFLPAKRNIQGGIVRTLVAETKKDKEKRRVQKVVNESSLDVDLAKAIEVCFMQFIVRCLTHPIVASWISQRWNRHG